MNPVVGAILVLAIGAIPDSSTMAGLRDLAGRSPVLRATGDRWTKELRHPLLDSSGVRSADWEAAARRRPALLVTPDAAPPATPLAPIPWSEIQRLETVHQRKLAGAAAGAGLGLVVALATTLGLGSGSEVAPTGIISGSIVIGAILGTFAGSLRGAKTIYRTRMRESH